MARIKHQKARKDYPDSGIKKGDMYYYTKIKTGPRSSRVMRSLTPFRQSQITTSPFKSGWYAAQEAWGEGTHSIELLQSVAESIREIGQEAQDNFDNMPESLQYGSTGEMLEERANKCEEVADALDDLVSEAEALEEPEKPEEVAEPDDDEAEDFLAKTDAWETYQDDLADYEALLEEYEGDLQGIFDQVDDHLGDMPE